jgi:hypothetical protein
MHCAGSKGQAAPAGQLHASSDSSSPGKLQGQVSLRITTFFSMSDRAALPHRRLADEVDTLKALVNELTLHCVLSGVLLPASQPQK